MNAHDFAFEVIGGGQVALSNYRGHPLLLVNTASECGFTPQYADLQRLWERYRERGLVVLGVPSNDFGAQEPGDESQIAEFCTKTYGVDFPITAKQMVIGAEAHGFYRWIASEVGEAGIPKWNFHKYLIDGTGNLAGIWPSRTDPLDREIVAAIEEQLGE